MIRFAKRLSVLMAVLFLLTVLTPEPERLQGYQSDDFPVFVESDAAFALCSTDFNADIRCFLMPEGALPPQTHPSPVSWRAVSGNPSRAPPAISLIS